MKPKYFSLAAFFAAIPIMFFACSDSGGGPNGPSNDPSNNPLTENFQIYSESSDKWNKDGTIRMRIYNENRGKIDFVDVGTVKKGKGTLNLPDDMSDYLVPLSYVLPPSLNISQDGVMATDEFEFYVISGDEAFELEANYYKAERASEIYEGIDYVYVSKVVDVTGNFSEDRIDFEFDIKAKKGWNVMYTSCTFSSNNGSCRASTDEKTVGNDIKWYVDYAGPSYYFGGPEDGSDPSPSGTWCVDHQSEECINEPYFLTPETCSSWMGVLQDYCPNGYYREGSGGGPTGACYVDHVKGYNFDACIPSLSTEECEYSDGKIRVSCPTNFVCFYEDAYIYGEDADLVCEDGGGDETETYCAIDEDDERYCIPTSYLQQLGYSCYMLDGVPMDYCPAGYQTF